MILGVTHSTSQYLKLCPDRHFELYPKHFNFRTFFRVIHSLVCMYVQYMYAMPRNQTNARNPIKQNMTRKCQYKPVHQHQTPSSGEFEREKIGLGCVRRCSTKRLPPFPFISSLLINRNDCLAQQSPQL